MPETCETNVLSDREGVLDLRRKERLGEGELEVVLDRRKERLAREEGELGGVVRPPRVESECSGVRALLCVAERPD